MRRVPLSALAEDLLADLEDDGRPQKWLESTAVANRKQGNTHYAPNQDQNKGGGKTEETVVAGEGAQKTNVVPPLHRRQVKRSLSEPLLGGCLPTEKRKHHSARADDKNGVFSSAVQQQVAGPNRLLFRAAEMDDARVRDDVGPTQGEKEPFWRFHAMAGQPFKYKRIHSRAPFDSDENKTYVASPLSFAGKRGHKSTISPSQQVTTSAGCEEVPAFQRMVSPLGTDKGEADVDVQYDTVTQEPSSASSFESSPRESEKTDARTSSGLIYAAVPSASLPVAPSAPLPAVSCGSSLSLSCSAGEEEGDATGGHACISESSSVSSPPFSSPPSSSSVMMSVASCSSSCAAPGGSEPLFLLSASARAQVQALLAVVSRRDEKYAEGGSTAEQEQLGAAASVVRPGGLFFQASCHTRNKRTSAHSRNGSAPQALATVPSAVEASAAVASAVEASAAVASAVQASAAPAPRVPTAPAKTHIGQRSYFAFRGRQLLQQQQQQEEEEESGGVFGWSCKSHADATTPPSYVPTGGVSDDSLASSSVGNDVFLKKRRPSVAWGTTAKGDSGSVCGPTASSSLRGITSRNSNSQRELLSFCRKKVPLPFSSASSVLLGRKRVTREAMTNCRAQLLQQHQQSPPAHPQQEQKQTQPHEQHAQHQQKAEQQQHTTQQQQPQQQQSPQQHQKWWEADAWRDGGCASFLSRTSGAAAQRAATTAAVAEDLFALFTRERKEVCGVSPSPPEVAPAALVGRSTPMRGTTSSDTEKESLLQDFLQSEGDSEDDDDNSNPYFSLKARSSSFSSSSFPSSSSFSVSSSSFLSSSLCALTTESTSLCACCRSSFCPPYPQLDEPFLLPAMLLLLDVRMYGRLCCVSRCVQRACESWAFLVLDEEASEAEQSYQSFSFFLSKGGRRQQSAPAVSPPARETSSTTSLGGAAEASSHVMTTGGSAAVTLSSDGASGPAAFHTSSKHLQDTRHLDAGYEFSAAVIPSLRCAADSIREGDVCHHHERGIGSSLSLPLHSRKECVTFPMAETAGAGESLTSSAGGLAKTPACFSSHDRAAVAAGVITTKGVLCRHAALTQGPASAVRDVASSAPGAPCELAEPSAVAGMPLKKAFSSVSEGGQPRTTRVWGSDSPFTSKPCKMRGMGVKRDFAVAENSVFWLRYLEENFPGSFNPELRSFATPALRHYTCTLTHTCCTESVPLGGAEEAAAGAVVYGEAAVNSAENGDPRQHQQQQLMRWLQQQQQQGPILESDTLCNSATRDKQRRQEETPHDSNQSSQAVKTDLLRCIKRDGELQTDTEEKSSFSTSGRGRSKMDDGGPSNDTYNSSNIHHGPSSSRTNSNIDRRSDRISIIGCSLEDIDDHVICGNKRRRGSRMSYSISTTHSSSSGADGQSSTDAEMSSRSDVETDRGAAEAGAVVGRRPASCVEEIYRSSDERAALNTAGKTTELDRGGGQYVEGSQSADGTATSLNSQEGCFPAIFECVAYEPAEVAEARKQLSSVNGTGFKSDSSTVLSVSSTSFPSSLSLASCTPPLSSPPLVSCDSPYKYSLRFADRSRDQFADTRDSAVSLPEEGLSGLSYFCTSVDTDSCLVSSSSTTIPRCCSTTIIGEQPILPVTAAEGLLPAVIAAQQGKGNTPSPGTQKSSNISWEAAVSEGGQQRVGSKRRYMTRLQGSGHADNRTTHNSLDRNSEKGARHYFDGEEGDSYSIGHKKFSVCTRAGNVDSLLLCLSARLTAMVLVSSAKYMRQWQEEGLLTGWLWFQRNILRRVTDSQLQRWGVRCPRKHRRMMHSSSNSNSSSNDNSHRESRRGRGMEEGASVSSFSARNLLLPNESAAVHTLAPSEGQVKSSDHITWKMTGANWELFYESVVAEMNYRARMLAEKILQSHRDLIAEYDALAGDLVDVEEHLFCLPFFCEDGPLHEHPYEYQEPPQSQQLVPAVCLRQATTTTATTAATPTTIRSSLSKPAAAAMEEEAVKEEEQEGKHQHQEEGEQQDEPQNQQQLQQQEQEYHYHHQQQQPQPQQQPRQEEGCIFSVVHGKQQEAELEASSTYDARAEVVANTAATDKLQEGSGEKTEGNEETQNIKKTKRQDVIKTAHPPRTAAATSEASLASFTLLSPSSFSSSSAVYSPQQQQPSGGGPLTQLKENTRKLRISFPSAVSLLKSLNEAWDDYEEWAAMACEALDCLDFRISQEREACDRRWPHTPGLFDAAKLQFRNVCLLHSQLMRSVCLALYALIHELEEVSSSSTCVAEREMHCNQTFSPASAVAGAGGAAPYRQRDTEGGCCIKKTEGTGGREQKRISRNAAYKAIQVFEAFLNQLETLDVMDDGLSTFSTRERFRTYLLTPARQTSSRVFNDHKWI